MGVKMLLPVILAFIGAIAADPELQVLRDDLEFLSTNLDEPNYRLRDTVQPRFLNVDLDVFLDESRFIGHVEIEVDVAETLSQIVLHQHVVSIEGVSVFNTSSGLTVDLRSPGPYETDDYYELLKINLDQPIPAGTYTLVIDYIGQINENPFDRGFYKGYYFYNDEKRYYATTQFQPYHARKAFPCFDEPQFKSRYVIAITRDIGLGESYSNMNITSTEQVGPTRIKETFLPTPIISAYLVAFHVSDFVRTNDTAINAKPFAIISRPGVEDQHPYAAEIGLEITNQLDDYLEFQYYDMGDGEMMKNDHIALPDFPSGAMENWGMVNYREAYLLYDEDNTNMLNKIFIATIMAHELAHKWFGNLVTCFWWGNLWLNESYASFFEYFAADLADPDLELADQFIVDYVHSALSWDSGAGATPMNYTAVDNNPSISSHFSTTSYAKGASVLRMMEHFVGTDNFKQALRNYIAVNAYGLGTPEAVYDGFRTAVALDPTFAADYGNIDVGAVFDSWVQTPGAPVLNVDVNMNTGLITITQERFQLTGIPPNSIWRIPVTWTHSGDLSFESTRPAFVMSERTRYITKEPGHHWVIFNIRQSGLYRVNYDDHNWEMLANYLASDQRESIHKLNRAQIVNDVLFFIRAGKIDIDRAIHVLTFLKNETDYYVWAGALGQFDWIRRRLEHLPVAHAEFSNWLLWLMDDVIEHLGYEDEGNEDTSVILNRMQIMNYACNNLGHQGCIEYSLDRWRQHRATNVLVPKNARRYVYCVGLREGDESDYNFLFNKYNTSENTADMVVILRALSCTRHAPSFQNYLEQSLYNDKIRFHDKTNAFSFALQGNPENLRPVLNFLYSDYRLIEEYYGGVARLNTAISSLSTHLTDFNTINEFQTWVYRNQLEIPESFSTGNSTVTTAMNNLQWSQNVAADMIVSIRARSSAASITASAVIILAAALVHLFK